jgi:succinate-semialdehyde dehydrogenase / glutarate-semialdehyde dehydrogenase
MVAVRNPRTGQHDYAFDEPSTAAIATMCQQMRNAQTAWGNSNIEQRIAALQQWKQAVIQQREALIDSLSIDTGRYHETVLEVDLVAASIDRWSGIAKDFFAPPAAKQSSIPFLQLQQAVVPYSLVGVISPWNFPLLLSLIDTIPALLAGCAVLVKPSEVTPRFAAVLSNSIEQVPALKNILIYLQGTGSSGAAMVEQCDLICFTGSTATGKKVYDAASKKMIPVFLELGGKDPAIVAADADLDLASSSILWGSTVNAGQSCLSIERVYVHQSIFEQFIEQLVNKAKKIKLTKTGMQNGQIGPIIFEKQAQIINDHLADAVAKGAKIVYGSQQCEQFDGGYYCLPTIVTHVDHGMKLMQEETFGPIIPVMAFDSIERAVQLANDTQYGLSAAVFAASNETAMQIGAQLHGGAISINDCALTAVMHEGEKNSFKLSGIGGTRMGPSAIKRFMRQKVFIVKNQAIKSPWWFKDA